MNELLQKYVRTALLVLPRYIQYGIGLVFMYLRNNHKRIWKAVDLFSLFLVDFFRFFNGKFIAGGLDAKNAPQQPIILYEYEACPFCKKVRELMSVLDLDYLAYPCPRETLKSHAVYKDSRYRPAVKKSGGTLMFPYMEDPNTQVKMYNSEDIMRYLISTYAPNASLPYTYRIANYGPLKFASLLLVSFCRPLMDMGILRVPSRKPSKPLEVWGYEASGHVRRVREVLSSLELQHVMHTIALGSPKRPTFLKKHQNQISDLRKKLHLIQVPFLRDPNNNVELFESEDIVKYLNDTYKTGDAPNESWLDFGKDNVTQNASANTNTNEHTTT